MAKFAAMSCPIVALLMALIVGNANADELQASQLLLQQRIDQLAAVGQKTGNWEMFSVDTNPAASAPAIAGSFPRSILIPGTDTSLKVYGQISEVLDYWMSGGGAVVNASPQTTTAGDNGQVQSMPLNNGGPAHARGNGVFSQS